MNLNTQSDQQASASTPMRGNLPLPSLSLRSEKSFAVTYRVDRIFISGKLSKRLRRYCFDLQPSHVQNRKYSPGQALLNLEFILAICCFHVYMSIRQMFLSRLEHAEKRTFYDHSQLPCCERGVRQVSVIMSHFNPHIFGYLHSNGNLFPGETSPLMITV
jgi:hypothetical protein